MDQLWPNPKVRSPFIVVEMFTGKLKPPKALAQIGEASKQGS
jgi:hypothetical protein